jgi:hypothetical protein
MFTLPPNSSIMRLVKETLKNCVSSLPVSSFRFRKIYACRCSLSPFPSIKNLIYMSKNLTSLIFFVDEDFRLFFCSLSLYSCEYALISPSSLIFLSKVKHGVVLEAYVSVILIWQITVSSGAENLMLS